MGLLEDIWIVVGGSWRDCGSEQLLRHGLPFLLSTNEAILHLAQQIKGSYIPLLKQLRLEYESITTLATMSSNEESPSFPNTLVWEDCDLSTNMLRSTPSQPAQKRTRTYCYFYDPCTTITTSIDLLSFSAQTISRHQILLQRHLQISGTEEG